MRKVQCSCTTRNEPFNNSATTTINIFLSSVITAGEDKTKRSKHNQLFLTTCINKSLRHKYSWGDSISSKKIKNDSVTLPAKDGEIDYAIMGTLISAIQKLVIKDVVAYSDRKIAATKEVIDK